MLIPFLSYNLFLIFESLNSKVFDYINFLVGFIPLLLISGVVWIGMYRKREFDQIIHMAHRRGFESDVLS